MPKPIGAKNGTEVKIGERVHDIAKRELTIQDAVDIRRWTQRIDGDATEFSVLPLKGELDDVKLLIVPPLDAIKEGIKRLKADSEDYDLRDEYNHQCFANNLEAIRIVAENLDPGDKRDYVLDFLDGIKPPKKMKSKEFFYFRLGEYCVNQCY